MKVAQQKYDVGVIVARFQVPDLHAAHRDLIDTVVTAHGKVVLLLGNAPVKSTRENPLDFEARKQMILADYPAVTVLYINDMSSDEAWSDRLDDIVEDQLTPSQTAVLYGSRHSFASHYTGRLPVLELESEVFVSGTELRKNIARSSTKATPDWRAGAIWATTNRFPTAFPTVDIALFNENGDRLLMARKKDESMHRFVGGFVMPGESLETAAKREAYEETGLGLSDVTYVKSMPVDDWRYRHDDDGIVTSLFRATVLFGTPKPGDDLKGGELRWFRLAELRPHLVTESHRPLLEALGEWVQTTSMN